MDESNFSSCCSFSVFIFHKLSFGVIEVFCIKFVSVNMGLWMYIYTHKQYTHIFPHKPEQIIILWDIWLIKYST